MHTKPETSSEDQQVVRLFFINGITTTLESENRNIKGSTKKELLFSIIEELKAGPKNPELLTSIPKQIEFLSITLQDEIATIDLSSAYEYLKLSEEVIFRASLVKTLTELPFVNHVKISIEGKELLSNGQPVGAMGTEDIVSSSIISPEPVNTQTVKLYFGTYNGDALDFEERRIEVNPNEPLEKYIIDQLIVGPVNTDFISTVPVETKIKDIKTIDSVCYVDLNSDFRAKHPGGSSGEILTIYSIVNSLTELSDVKKVQFLIEGKKSEIYKGHIDFSKPFERNTEIIHTR
jgi:germination protein M